MDEANPHLKAAFMEVVDNQLRDNEPPETRETYNRLIAQGVSKEDARIYIGQAVCVEVWDIMRNKKPFNRERFIRNLNNLPEEPTE
ncbi:MAG: hypothetical protein U1E27_08820 [Kiritimatiellia bacterium]|nr:hypothetical protein [Kiritimatiellia bacterium]